MSSIQVESSTGRWNYRLAAVALIVGTAALRIFYLAHNCPLDLAPDEAHYWDWSRHLDWSYYSKGPLVAYLIRLSCDLAGGWSRSLTGTEMLAVRLPAVLCGSLLLTSLYVLTVQVFRRDSLALAVVIAALTSPVLAAGSILMTIDAPYACCWGWALVVGYQAIFRRSSWAWPVLGLVIGLGILAKYTMVMWLPSVGLFFLSRAEYRPLLFRRGFWVAVAIVALCCLPILIWNFQHGGLTFRHVGGQAGLAGPTTFRWWGPLNYIGVQFALLLGFWFCAWVIALWQYRPGRETDAGIAYLWWLSAPMFALFLTFSVVTLIEPNWPVTAYISGLVLAAGWLSHALGQRGALRSWTLLLGATVACSLGLLLILAAHHSEWFHPVLGRLAGEPSAQRPLPLRRVDPTCRLRGWQSLAADLDDLRDQLRREADEPIVAGVDWTLPGELGFYCRGNPAVYSLGLALGDRHSQYDLWHPNPLSESKNFAGRTFIVVGDIQPTLKRAFDQVSEPFLTKATVDGRPVAAWKLTVCRGFHGFNDGGAARPY
jgi:hypothetical protein